MKIGIIVNPKKPLVTSVVPELLHWLVQRKQEVWIAEENELPILKMKELNYCKKLQELPEVCEIILAIGGDGTLLKTAHIVGESEIPILGINLGGLGFITEVAIDNLYPALTKLLASQYTIETRMVLEAKISGNKFCGLNDIVLTGSGSGRMLQFVLWIDSTYVSHFSADGMIFSTPTGSTAYSLAALGPILYPTTDAIVINLICPHTLGARPIIIGANSIMEAKCESDNAIVVIDGQIKVTLNKDEKLVVQKASHKVRLIKSGIRDFYEILRTKLKWGGSKER